MLKLIKKVFGIEATPDYAHLVRQGAKIVDVRSHAEFKHGHIKSSVNIPLDRLKNEVKLLPEDKQSAIVTCCVSGVRSSAAKSILKRMGYSNVHNGGGWLSLQYELRKAGFEG